MQLPRDNCHIRANVLVILVAASGRAKVNTKRGVGDYTRSPLARGQLLVRAQATIRADGFSSAQILPKPARCARQPSFLNGCAFHPFRKLGYATTPQRLPHPRECFCHFGCGQQQR